MRRLLLFLALVAVASAVAWYFLRPQAYEGYTGRVSYLPGQEMRVHLSARWKRQATTMRLHDASGHAVDSVVVSVRRQETLGQSPWRDGFGWTPTFTYRIPEALPSGVYRWAGVAPFVVRRDGPAEVVVLYPSNTVAAYNTAGGKSLYVPTRAYRLRRAYERLIDGDWSPLFEDPYGLRARAVSFQRPGGTTHWSFFEPFLAWMHRQPYDAAYIADADLDDPATLDGARLLVVIGHSEYWTRRARVAFDRFVEGGRPALILSGNTMWWHARYIAEGTKLACYREAAEDPALDPLDKTLVWTDPRLEYPIVPSIGARFDLGGYGEHDDAGWDGYRVVAAASPLLAGVALPADSILSLRTREYDGTLLVSGSAVPRPDTARLGFHRAEIIGYDHGTYQGRQTTGTFLAFQRHPGAGVVVNAGSMNWCSDTGIGGPDSSAVRRITANAIERLLAGDNVFSDRL